MHWVEGFRPQADCRLLGRQSASKIRFPNRFTAHEHALITHEHALIAYEHALITYDAPSCGESRVLLSHAAPESAVTCANPTHFPEIPDD